MQNRQSVESAVRKAKKNVPDLSIGSTFLLGVGAQYPAQVKVLSRKGETVRIEVSLPARPKNCRRCGHGLNLSVNATTGVIVCMTSGCGRDFGYRPIKTTTMNVSDFAPA